MNKIMKRSFHVIIVLVLLASGFVGMKTLMAGKDKLKRRKPAATMPVVRTITVQTNDQAVIISGEGTVRPLHVISLVPQVGGRVISVSSALVNGGAFRKGETLLRIDPEDYQLAVTLAEAKIKDSESKLKLLREEAEAAREEWRIHRGGGMKGREEPPPLVVKEPQLLAAQARLEADKADLRKAKLNLARTVLRAPFNGRVDQESVGVGQYVTHGQSVAKLFSTDAVEVVLPLETRDLNWFHVPGFTPGDNEGSPAVIKARIAGEDLTWKGDVVRSEGKLDERTRMVNVVVRVNAPYAERPPLAVGLFVTVEIMGKTLQNASVIPRAALHQGNQVWVVRDGRLRFRQVDVARIERDEVLVRSGLTSGDQLVTSTHKAVSDNMAVRVNPAGEPLS